jgi:hypothetical protein
MFSCSKFRRSRGRTAWLAVGILTLVACAVVGRRWVIATMAGTTPPIEPAADTGLRACTAGGPDNTQPPQLAARRLTGKPDCSRAAGTESGQLGDVELVDAGDNTPNFAEFAAQQIEVAEKNHRHCLFVTMLPKCPSCAALGYALKRGYLGHKFGRIRIVRLDLDEFEEDMRRMHLPIDRVPGFILMDRSGKVIDFLDAGEWTSNDPAEFAPLISDFARGRLPQGRYNWSRNSLSRAVDL